MDPVAAELEEYTIDVLKKRIREELTESLDKLRIPLEDMAGVISGVDKLVCDFVVGSKSTKKRKKVVSHYDENYVHIKYLAKTPSTSSKSCTPVSSQDRSSKGKSPSTSRQSYTPVSSQEISSQGCDGTGDDLNILDICPPLYAGYEDDNSAGWSTGVKDDIANLGIILFSLLFDSKLVPVEERPLIWRNLKNLKFPSPWRFDDKYSVVREFILSMFKVDRPSPSSILEDIPLKVLLIE